MTSPDTLIDHRGRNEQANHFDLAIDCPSFRLELGGAIAPLSIRASLDGPEHAPLVAVLGGISADRFPICRPDGGPGWWAECLTALRRRSGHPLRFLSCDYVYRPFDPRSDPGPGFAVTAGDQARVLCQVLDHLEIARVEAVIGASYGGAVALTLAERYPDRIGRLVVAGAADEPHPMAVAGRLIQRRIVQLAARGGNVREGLALARQLAMTSYRSFEEFAERFTGPPGVTEDAITFEVGQYLTTRGAAFSNACAPDRFLALSQSLDLHRADPGKVTAPATLIACREDRLVPSEQMESLARRLAGPVDFHAISSRYAHDAFLKETDVFAEFMARALNPDLVEQAS